MNRKRKSLTTFVFLVVCLVVIQACNLPFGAKTTEEAPATTGESEVFIPIVEGETETEEPMVEEETEPEATEESPTAEPVVHNVTPAEPGWVSKYFFDTDSSTTAASKSAGGGDDFYDNKYERPFSQNEMVYLPDLDIQKAEISHDDNFYYISITVKGLNPTSNSLTGTYGAELDIDLDGRGDYLFYCDLPSFTDWKIDTVHAFKDGNNDVGGSIPTSPETSATSDGYETLIFSPSLLTDPDGLWCRQRQGTDTRVDLAIHKTLIGSPGQFAWGVWADLGLKQPGWFEYNDHFTFDQAGSPMAGNSYYPLKEIHSVDSTCRESFGFEPTTEIPGMCFVPEPTPTTPPPTATNTLPPRPGSVSGVAFDDMNNNGIRDLGDPLTFHTVTISLHRDACGGGLHIFIGSTTNKSYTFTVAPGTYCVYIAPTGSMTTPYSFTIAITSSTTIYRDFGYYVIGR